MAGPDKKYWDIAVNEEHGCFEASNAFEVVPISEAPPDAKTLTSTWAMKKKANGTFRARLNARGFEQRDGEHYDSSKKAVPVAQQATIMIILTTMTMAAWHAASMDAKRAFLLGEFDPGIRIFMWIPQGFKKFHPIDVTLLPKKTIHGLKQAAMAFWKALVEAFRKMNFQRNKGW